MILRLLFFIAVLGLTGLACLLALLAPGAAGAGTTFTVTRTDDPVPNGCAPADCSLREAIIAANNLAGADVITLPTAAQPYTLTIAGFNEDAAATGDLDITGALTINGAGAGSTIINGNRDVTVDRVFHVISAVNVNISGVTIQNGDGLGAGIYNQGGTLTINSSTVTANVAVLTDGGGIVNTGNLTLNNSTVSGNVASFNGGGIFNNGGTMTLNNSDVTGNSATDGGGIYTTGTATINGDSAVSGNGAGDHGGGIFDLGVLTVTDSTVSDNTAVGRGGGIWADGNGSVTVTDSTLRNNKTTGDASGGAVYLYDATGVFTDTTISGNKAGASGGGIANAGALTLNNSTVSGNEAKDGTGGGIRNENTVTINQSTVSGNSSTSDGGGIVNVGGPLTLNNSTVSGNDAAGNGGGIRNAGALTIANSTVSGNTAGAEGAGIRTYSGTVSLNNVTVSNNTADSVGGGIIRSGSEAVNFKNTVIAGNFDAGSNPDCYGSLTSQGYNLIQTVSPGCSIGGDTTGNITGQPAGLGSLADNGGPTETHALLPGSPAIDAANPAAPGSGGNACEPADQRGVARPIDGDAVPGARCDIGAFEAPPLATPTPTPSPSPSPSATPSPSPTPAPTATPDGVLKRGDVNCNGLIQPNDGLELVVHAAGIPINHPGCPQIGGTAVIVGGGTLIWGDEDCDNDADIDDMMALLRYMFGLQGNQVTCDPGATLGDVVPGP